jgi:hypothetical protein
MALTEDLPEDLPDDLPEDLSDLPRQHETFPTYFPRNRRLYLPLYLLGP